MDRVRKRMNFPFGLTCIGCGQEQEELLPSAHRCEGFTKIDAWTTEGEFGLLSDPDSGKPHDPEQNYLSFRTFITEGSAVSERL
jgi:hypothetical protein